MIADCKFSQLIKVLFPIEVTVAGIVMDLRFMQLENAHSPIVSNPSARSIELSCLQLLNAAFQSN